MDEIFILKLALSFVIGGSYIAFVTRISELLGAKIGAVLSATPTTALIGMIFLAMSEDKTALASAAPGMIIGFGASVLLLISYVYLRKKINTAKALSVSIVLWFVFAAFAQWLEIADILNSTLIFLLMYGISILAMRRIPEHQAKKNLVSMRILLLRAVFAGTIIAITQIVARFAGPFWGGVAATFPALFISSIVILEHEQSHKFTASIIKHLPLGIFSLLTFAIVLGLSVETLGSAIGISLSFVMSLVASYVIYIIKNRAHYS